PAAPPGASVGMPAAPPAPPMSPAPVLPPALVIAPPMPPIHPPPIAPEPNAATGPRPLGDPSVAITSPTPVFAEPRPVRPARPWLPWAITAAAIMLPLMAFGAGQSLRDEGQREPESDAPRSEPGAEPHENPDARRPTVAEPSSAYDRECTNKQRCELSCAKECSARCADADRCEISVGPDSRAICDHVGKCEVRCAGDCEVECPGSNCEVTCSRPSSGRGRGKDDKDDKDDKGDKKA